MRQSRLLLSLLASFLLTFSSSIVFGQKEASEDVISKVKFEVVSQRMLSEKEQSKAENPLDSPNISVRVRLSNQSKKEIYFVVFDTGENIYAYPLGFHYTRKIGDKDWKRMSTDNTFTGIGYRHLVLSPGMAIECDFGTWGQKDYEQRFSVSLSLEKDGKRFEVFSDIFRPIKK
ncbi:MAG: hypothetical protein ACK5NT_04000 [Pyrinomonadaceae bacterium]